jgi:breast cancer 2 susceptibility protein
MYLLVTKFVFECNLYCYTPDTAIGYRVPAADGTGVTLSAADLRQRMLSAGAVDRLLDVEWVRNAHRWVVWQQACIARGFPDELAGEALSAPCVLQRLLYRYEREVLRAQRPHLRRVLERDTPAGAPAVLVIAAVRRTGRVGIFHHVVLFCSRNTNT